MHYTQNQETHKNVLTFEQMPQITFEQMLVMLRPEMMRKQKFRAQMPPAGYLTEFKTLPLQIDWRPACKSCQFARECYDRTIRMWGMDPMEYQNLQLSEIIDETYNRYPELYPDCGITDEWIEMELKDQEEMHRHALSGNDQYDPDYAYEPQDIDECFE